MLSRLRILLTGAVQGTGFRPFVYLSLIHILRDFIIVNEPMQHLCQPECKGLCPHCGANRNTVECNCAEQHANLKLAALRKL